ncbi:MAG: OmpA family protein [Bacteroidota bacterium]
MKNFLIAFLVFLVWSFFGLWLYSWLQPIDNSSSNTDTIATVETEEPGLELDEPLQVDQGLEIRSEATDTTGLAENVDDPVVNNELPSGLKAVTSGDDLLFLFDDGISIWKNTDHIEYSTDISDFKYKLNTYLIEHPNEELHIASLYSASENIENPNYGYQRGNKIKGILKNTGLANERMVVKPLIREIAFDENDRFQNGISFSFHPLDVERIESLKLSLPETKTLYPKFVNNDIFANKALQDLLAEVKEAITSDPNLSVEIVGHTDNVGNANDNYLIGLKYARQVRWYLVTKGKIDRNKISAISEGESKSIASNKTERGRLLNRRIEIRYKTN